MLRPLFAPRMRPQPIKQPGSPLLPLLSRHRHAARVAASTLRVIVREPGAGGRRVGAGTAFLVSGSDAPGGGLRLMTAAHVACALPACSLELLDADGTPVARAEVVARARPWTDHSCQFAPGLPRGDMAVLEAKPLPGMEGDWAARPGLALATPSGNELLACFSCGELDLRGASGGPLVDDEGFVLGILIAGSRLRDDGVTMVFGEAPWDPHLLWALGAAGAEAAASPPPDRLRWPTPATAVGFPLQEPWAACLPLEPWRGQEPENEHEASGPSPR